MNLQLRDSVTYDVVGDRIVFLNMATSGVYTLPVDVVNSCGDLSITLRPGTTHRVVQQLVEAGIVHPPGSSLSRRSLLAGSGVVAGAGLVAMSLPGVAAASSTGAPPQDPPVQPKAAFWFWEPQLSWGQVPLVPTSFVVRVLLSADEDFPIDDDTFNYNPEWPATPGGTWSVAVTFGPGAIAIADDPYSEPPPFWDFASGTINESNNPTLFTRMSQYHGDDDPPELAGSLRRNGVEEVPLILTWPQSRLWPNLF